MRSFLFTTIAAVVGVVMLAPSYATNIPTTNPGCTTTVLGADNIANGSASLEPDFSANTINTTWYSNGTQLTGDNIPGTCRYDAALTPPTPSNRPGYVFAGWKVKRCEIPNSLVSTYGSGYGYKNDSSLSGYDPIFSPYSENASDYGLTEDNTWGVSWSNGDKVVGEAKCSALRGYNNRYAYDGDSASWTASESALTSASGETQWCWCKVTGYIANGAEQCQFASSLWVFTDQDSEAGWCGRCATRCAVMAQQTPEYKSAIFTGLLAQ